MPTGDMSADEGSDVEWIFEEREKRAVLTASIDGELQYFLQRIPVPDGRALAPTANDGGDRADPHVKQIPPPSAEPRSRTQGNGKALLSLPPAMGDLHFNPRASGEWISPGLAAAIPAKPEGHGVPGARRGGEEGSARVQDLLCTVAPSVEDKGMHLKLSELRTALQTSHQALASAGKEAHALRHRISKAEERAAALETQIRSLEGDVELAGGRLHDGSLDLVRGRLLVEARILVEQHQNAAALAALREKEARQELEGVLRATKLAESAAREERERLSLEAAEARLLCQARGRQMDEMQTELERLQHRAKSDVAFAEEQQKRALEQAAESARRREEAERRASAAERRAIEAEARAETSDDKIASAAEREADSEERARQARVHSEWLESQLASFEGHDGLETARRYGHELRSLRERLEADKREAVAELEREREARVGLEQEVAVLRKAAASMNRGGTPPRADAAPEAWMPGTPAPAHPHAYAVSPPTEPTATTMADLSAIDTTYTDGHPTPARMGGAWALDVSAGDPIGSSATHAGVSQVGADADCHVGEAGGKNEWEAALGLSDAEEGSVPASSIPPSPERPAPAVVAEEPERQPAQEGDMKASLIAPVREALIAAAREEIEELRRVNQELLARLASAPAAAPGGSSGEDVRTAVDAALERCNEAWAVKAAALEEEAREAGERGVRAEGDLRRVKEELEAARTDLEIELAAAVIADAASAARTAPSAAVPTADAGTQVGATPAATAEAGAQMGWERADGSAQAGPGEVVREGDTLKEKEPRVQGGAEGARILRLSGELQGLREALEAEEHAAAAEAGEEGVGGAAAGAPTPEEMAAALAALAEAEARGAAEGEARAGAEAEAARLREALEAGAEALHAAEARAESAALEAEGVSAELEAARTALKDAQSHADEERARLGAVADEASGEVARLGAALEEAELRASQGAEAVAEATSEVERLRAALAASDEGRTAAETFEAAAASARAELDEARAAIKDAEARAASSGEAAFQLAEELAEARATVAETEAKLAEERDAKDGALAETREELEAARAALGETEARLAEAERAAAAELAEAQAAVGDAEAALAEAVAGAGKAAAEAAVEAEAAAVRAVEKKARAHAEAVAAAAEQAAQAARAEEASKLESHLAAREEEVRVSCERAGGAALAAAMASARAQSEGEVAAAVAEAEGSWRARLEEAEARASAAIEAAMADVAAGHHAAVEAEADALRGAEEARRAAVEAAVRDALSHSAEERDAAVAEAVREVAAGHEAAVAAAVAEARREAEDGQAEAVEASVAEAVAGVWREAEASWADAAEMMEALTKGAVDAALADARAEHEGELRVMEQRLREEGRAQLEAMREEALRQQRQAVRAARGEADERARHQRDSEAASSAAPSPSPSPARPSPRVALRASRGSSVSSVAHQYPAPTSGISASRSSVSAADTIFASSARGAPAGGVAAAAAAAHAHAVGGGRGWDTTEESASTSQADDEICNVADTPESSFTLPGSPPPTRGQGPAPHSSPVVADAALFNLGVPAGAGSSSLSPASQAAAGGGGRGAVRLSLLPRVAAAAANRELASLEEARASAAGFGWEGAADRSLRASRESERSARSAATLPAQNVHDLSMASAASGGTAATAPSLHGTPGRARRAGARGGWGGGDDGGKEALQLSMLARERSRAQEELAKRHLEHAQVPPSPPHPGKLPWDSAQEQLSSQRSTTRLNHRYSPRF